MTTLLTLHDLLVDQLQDIHDAEHQILAALPAMSNAAFDEHLQDAFVDHLAETHEHIDRLIEVFGIVGAMPKRKPCKAMAGLIRESEEVLNSTGDRDVLDAALIAAAQRIEHYEIASYGTVRAFAQRLGMDDAAKLLDKTLDEEGNTNKKLTKLAEGGMLTRSINKSAAKN
jgi:ferritin-like metal-binding protein YciE